MATISTSRQYGVQYKLTNAEDGSTTSKTVNGLNLTTPVTDADGTLLETFFQRMAAGSSENLSGALTLIERRDVF